MSDNKPKIVGVDNAKGGFDVSFKNGLDGELDMKMTGLHVDAAGGSAVYASIEACANYLLDSVNKMKAQPQVCFDMSELPTKDGKLNFNIKDGELLERPFQEGVATETPEEKEALDRIQKQAEFNNAGEG